MFQGGLFLLIIVKCGGFEIFRHNDVEYVLDKDKFTWQLAQVICQREHESALAALEYSEFDFVGHLIAALGIKEAVWIDPKTVHQKFRCSKFGNDTNCTAVVRTNHSRTCLTRLSCGYSRGFICKKRVTIPTRVSTHRSWIRLGSRRYKIFSERLTYQAATKACAEVNAALAVVENMRDARVIARYLLIGRPTLESVWIGARWSARSHQFLFDREPVVLQNETSGDYPPWPNGRIKGATGCILLDRHGASQAFFRSMRCSLPRPYLCYRKRK